MKKTLYAVLAVLALLGGAIGGDIAHRASGKATDAGAEDETAADHGSPAADHGEAGAAAEATAEPTTETDWFRFPNQFFVPLLRNGTTQAVMVLSLTLEVTPKALPRIEAQEQRLRDALLRALMIQANTGGFDDNFTAETRMSALRIVLLNAAQAASGPAVSRVLIGDIARQEP